MRSDALIIHKHDASKVIDLLRDKEIIDKSKKITQEDDQVFIPILRSDLSSYLGDIQYQIDNYQFEEKSTDPGSLKEALSQLLPDVDKNHFQTSFDQIGDIAIIDLNDELIPYDNQVGKAIMWSNNSIASVYRKSSKVDGLLRLRGLKHIGGEEKTRTIHKEHGLRIVVDVSLAYFSPRLATEHNRVADLIKPNTRVLDLFGGLAPFALHIANNKEIEIDTVDINPHVPQLIKSSIDLNTLEGKINIYEADAMQFLRDHNNMRYDYIIMNHPSGAYDYLTEAIKVIKPGGTVFYYDFILIENFEQNISKKLSQLDIYNQIMINNIHIVRQSSPTEYHVCVQLIRNN